MWSWACFEGGVRDAEKRWCAHSAHNDIENGGEGFATIGSAMAHQLARVPQQQSPGAHAQRVREAQGQPLGQPRLLSQLQRRLQLLRVRAHRSRLAHVRVHRAHLRDHLQRYANHNFICLIKNEMNIRREERNGPLPGLPFGRRLRMLAGCETRGRSS